MSEPDDNQALAEAIGRDGYCIVPGAFDDGFMGRVRDELEASFPFYREVHRRAGYLGETEGGAHHVLIRKGSFLDVLHRMPVTALLERLLLGKVIVNSYGAFNNARGGALYVKQVHRDVRHFSRAAPAMVNMLVMLDDFTLENGATYLLPASHHLESRPDEATFFAAAVRAVGRAGSLLLFDSRLWHASGENRTDQPRRALTLTFTRPHHKQQLDYCRALGYDFCETLPGDLKQLLGYYARVPATLEEWYQPAASRFYRADQDA